MKEKPNIVEDVQSALQYKLIQHRTAMATHHN